MGFLDIIFSLPTILYTIPLMFAVIYWLFVVAGAIDIDFLGLDGVLDGADGALDGALDGAADGALDGMADGGLDGAMEGASSGVGSLLSALNLRKVPLTVSLSLIFFFGWIATYIGSGLVASAFEPGAIKVAADAAVFLGSTVLSLGVTSQAVRPIAPAFQTHEAESRIASVGKVCTIRTGTVTESFGQAEVIADGASLLVEVRAHAENTLARGDQALIFDYDAENEAFIVEPMKTLLDGSAPTEAPRDDALEAAFAKMEAEQES